MIDEDESEKVAQAEAQDDEPSPFMRQKPARINGDGWVLFPLIEQSPTSRSQGETRIKRTRAFGPFVNSVSRLCRPTPEGFIKRWNVAVINFTLWSFGMDSKLRRA